MKAMEHSRIDSDPICPDCGAELVWEDCPDFCEDGAYDLYEENPIEYAPGETAPCDTCDGRGGWWYCRPRLALGFATCSETCTKNLQRALIGRYTPLPTERKRLKAGAR